MPSSLIRDKWPLGWTPSADETGGDPSGLLRADNLKLDKTGALTLTRGFKNVNTSAFAGHVHSLYSVNIFSAKHRFVGLSTGEVLHAADGVNFNHQVLDAGNPARARFTDALGSIFIGSGAKKRKYDGTNTFQWGIETPKNPVGIYITNQQSYDVSGVDGSGNYTGWESIEGLNFINSGSGAHIDSDATTLRASIGIKYVRDYTAFPGGGTGLDSDIFSFRVRLGDSARIERIRVEVGLGTITDLKDMPDYYWMEWQHDVDQTAFLEGIDNFTTLQVERSGFQRVGDNVDLTWANVGALRITLICNDISNDNLFQDFKLTGSTAGPLNGDIEYVQVNVRDNGIYVAKSAIGPKMDKQYPVINASIRIQPSFTSDPQVNQKWFYRRGAGLNAFYRIGVLDLNTGIYTDSTGRTEIVAANQPVTDICPDSAAIDLNITANENLISIADIQEEFLCILDGIYFERLVLLTQFEILVTERLNPDAIDNRFRFKVGGDITESLLWVSKIGPTTLQVGSTKNRYEFSGTLEESPDGTIDALIRALGEKHPPISLEFALDSGSIIYCANDGWRITAGATSELISGQLDLLFKNTACHGISAVAIYPQALAVYPVVVANGQIFTSNPLKDGSRQVFIFDLKLQYWRYHYCNPICLFIEEDGTILGGFGNPGDYYVKQLDTGSTIDTQGITSVGQEFFFETIYDSNNQPRNRKDAYTLKLLINTGDIAVNVHVSADNGGFVQVCQVKTPYLQDVYIDLFENFTQTYGLGLRYSVRITSQGFNVVTFQLNHLIIEYDARPELQTNLRLLSSNLGTFCRKRFTNFAFVVDTLGFNTQFQPTVDGANAGSPLNFSTSGKETIIYYFASEVVGTDIGGILKSVDNTADPVTSINRGAFEYYGINSEEIVSEKLPTPVKYLKIPSSDFGTPNRKRHSSYKFQLNTRGANVRFTPTLDGNALSSTIFNTSEKRTVEYFFTTDTISIDIGGVLESLADTPFEFYGVIIPQIIEALPSRLRELRIPENNYGVAAKKRVRTMPMEINTNGYDVQFTPIVDGAYLTPSLINTATRKTAFHYFTTDVFGVDFSAELVGANPFEFYKFLNPETVEVLPVSKKFDQVGPVYLPRIGKLIGFRIRIITGEVSLPWSIYAEDVVIASGTIDTAPNIDDVYEVEYLTKGRIAAITRMEIGPTAQPFNRYYVAFKINYGGNDSQIKVITIKDEFAMSQQGQ